MILDQMEKKELKKKAKILWADARPFSKRLLIAASVMLAAAYTFVFFGPLEMVAFSRESLYYSYRDAAPLLLAAMAGVTLLGTGLLMLLKGRIFNYAVGIVFSAVAAGYCQAGFLNGSLGTLTGEAVAWEKQMGFMLADALFWVLILILTFTAMYFHRKFWYRATVAVSAVLIAMQLVPTVMLFAGGFEDTQSKPIEEYMLTDAGIADYSEKENILVFVLDRLDYLYMESAMQEDPGMLEPFDGFTSYDNAVSLYARTRPGLNSILTATEHLAYREPFTDFCVDSWHQYGAPSVLQGLSDAGYRVECYTDITNLFGDPVFATEYVDNVSNTMGKPDGTKLLPKLMQLSAYRYGPVAVKPFAWATTDYYNDVFLEDTQKAYQFDDTGYARKMMEGNLVHEEPCFKFIHFLGPHFPYTMDAQGNQSPEPTTVEAQTRGSFLNLVKIFDRMKELGIYENATILITADHGSAIRDSMPVQQATRIGTLYKPSGSAGTPLQISHAPVGTTNIPATLMKAAGAAYSHYPAPLDEIGEQDDVVRYYYKSVTDPETYWETTYCTYEIRGDAADFDNWKMISTDPVDYHFG